MSITAYKRVGPDRFREDCGLEFEDFHEGLVIEHRPGRTVTRTDNTWQSLISMNQHPLHVDEEYARGTEFGAILVSSLVTFNIVNGMTVKSLSQKAIANLGWDKVRLLAPVFVGDTLTAVSEILSKRRSSSRPGQGIVTARTVGYKGDVAVIEYERSFLVPCRESSEAESSDPNG